MAPTSPAASGLHVEPVHAEGLSNLRSDSAFVSAVPPHPQGVQASDVASVWMPPDPSDEKDELVAGEFVIDIDASLMLRSVSCMRFAVVSMQALVPTDQPETQPESAALFQCSECPYRTDHISHLKAHMRVHTAEKPFKCS